MVLKVISNKSSVSMSKTEQVLPKDLEVVIGKVQVLKIEFFAKIKAFFLILFLGPCEDFNKNLKITALEITNKEKLKIYLNLKGKNLQVYQKKFMELTRISLEDVARLKKGNADRKVYDVFYATVSKKVDSLLQEIEDGNSSNYYSVLVSLRSLLDNKNIPNEIKNLINKKLDQIPKSANKRLFYVPENSELARYSLWKKIIIGALALVGVVAVGAAGYGIYRYLKNPIQKNPETESKLDFCYCENDSKSFGPFVYDKGVTKKIFDTISKPFSCSCTNGYKFGFEVKQEKNDFPKVSEGASFVTNSTNNMSVGEEFRGSNVSDLSFSSDSPVCETSFWRRWVDRNNLEGKQASENMGSFFGMSFFSRKLK